MNEMGIMAVAKTLQGVFKAMTGSEYSVIEAAKAIRTHEIKSKGQRIDVSAQVEAALNDHVETLINSIATRYKQSIAKLDHMILAGGGAYLIRKHLPQDWPVVVLEQPEFANVRGYFRAV
jgi:predicted naringenin-chalcone synthase